MLTLLLICLTLELPNEHTNLFRKCVDGVVEAKEARLQSSKHSALMPQQYSSRVKQITKPLQQMNYSSGKARSSRLFLEWFALSLRILPLKEPLGEQIP